MTDQAEAAERSARELERRIRMVCPPSLLADAYAFAVAFVRWEQAEHWRHVPPPPGWKVDPPNPEATARGVDMARDLLNIRKDDHHA
jgi:hypothetical protein